MKNRQVFFTHHALRWMRLNPCLVSDFLRFDRVRPAGPAKDNRNKYSFWNPLTKKVETLILCPNHCCVITMFQGRPDSLYNFEVEHMKEVARTPFYLPEFSAEVNNKKFCVTISAQHPKPSRKQGGPEIHKASFRFKSNIKSKAVGQILQSGELGEIIKERCQRQLGTLVPLRLEIDGIELPLSTILGSKEEKSCFPWSFTEYCDLITK